MSLFFYGLHRWRGESGKRYLFRCALTRNGVPADSGGIYVFVRRRFAFFLQPLYVGKAANLRSRLVGHEKWGRAWWELGATERHVMRVRTEEERRIIEEDLIRGLRPRMNDIQMPRSEADAPNSARLRKKWLWRREIAAFFRGLLPAAGPAASGRGPEEEAKGSDAAAPARQGSRREAPRNDRYWRGAA